MIEVAAVVLSDDSGRVLTVRKRGTTRWMLVGGKPAPDESPVACAVREVEEELGVVLDSCRLTLLGTFPSTAANEGVPLLAHVFVTDERASPVAQAEIEELRWVDPADPGEGQAPLSIDLVFPLLTALKASEAAAPTTELDDSATSTCGGWRTSATCGPSAASSSRSRSSSWAPSRSSSRA